MSNAAAAGAAHYSMVSNAIKACGSLIRLEEKEFENLLEKTSNPLVVMTAGRGMNPSRKYLTSYRGLTFHCKTKTELVLPRDAELVLAKKVSIPDL